MKRSAIILIDGLIAVAIIAGVYFYFKNQSVLDENPKPTVSLACGPAQSHDCTLKDFKVASGTLELAWQKLPLKIEKLPVDSWYKINKETETEYELTVYPNVGEHYILGNHDFPIIISVTKTDRKSTNLKCVNRSGFDESDAQKLILQSGPFDIQIQSDLNYYYDGGPGSNPNPYTAEVLKILKDVMIAIGKC